MLILCYDFRTKFHKKSARSEPQPVQNGRLIFSFALT
jgi:hypothetical protein